MTETSGTNNHFYMHHTLNHYMVLSHMGLSNTNFDLKRPKSEIIYMSKIREFENPIFRKDAGRGEKAENAKKRKSENSNMGGVKVLNSVFELWNVRTFSRNVTFPQPSRAF